MNNDINQQNVEQDNSQPQEDLQTSEEPVQEEKSMGAILGSIIVIIVLLVAAFYLWGKRSEESEPVHEPEQTAEEIIAEEDPLLEALEEQDSSDELEAIEADLEDTNLDDLAKELDDIDKELGL